MSDDVYQTVSRVLPPGSERGPMQGVEIIGEITEAMHRHLLSNWEFDRAPPRIEEDLSFVPKDREEVVYVYMYRAGMNRSLMNSKRFRSARFNHPGDQRIYMSRAPIYLDVFYLIAVHSKFRSDAEKLMGYVLLALHEATHLIYRPRKYRLPDATTVVNSKGLEWDGNVDLEDDEIVMEKVALSLVDDLSIGDAINFFTIHESPYRPYLTYSARCAMEGSIIATEPTQVRSMGATQVSDPRKPKAHPSGRLKRPEPASGRFKTPFGPDGHNPRRIAEPFADESTSESEE